MNRTPSEALLLALPDTLRQQGIRSSELVQQTALIVAWCWCAQHRSELSLPEPSQSSSLTAAMQALEKALQNQGLSVNLDTQLLDMKCSGEAQQAILKDATHLDVANRDALLEALARLAERYNPRKKMLGIPSQLAQLMLSLRHDDAESVVFTHADSIEVLSFATGVTDSVLLTPTFSSLMGAIGLMRHVAVEVMQPESWQGSAATIVAVPSLTGYAPVNSRTAFLSRGAGGAALQWAAETARRKAVVLVGSSVLSTRSDAALREKLVRENILDQVIQLPRGTLTNTSLTPSLLVINQDRAADEPVYFVDGGRLVGKTHERFGRRSSEWMDFWQSLNQLIEKPQDDEASRRVPTAQIRENGFNLALGHYVLGQASRKIRKLQYTHPLSNLAEIIRAQSFRDDHAIGGTSFVEVGVRDIAENGQVAPDHTTKRVTVAGNDYKRAINQRLYPGDVLLVGKGGIARVGLVDKCNDNSWVAGQVFLVIRPHDPAMLQPEFLYQYLASPLIQQYLQEIAGHSGIPLLKAHDVRSLPIPLPPAQTQSHVVEQHHAMLAEYEAINAHRHTIRSLVPEDWQL